MRYAANCLKFPVPARARLRRPQLRPATLAGIQRVMALAPLLGVCNPKGVDVVERVMLNLIGPALSGGVPLTNRATRAAAVTAHTRRRPAKCDWHRPVAVGKR